MNTFTKSLLAVALCVASSKAIALSCPAGLDPYELVESAYNQSDLVFVGRTDRSSSFKGHAPEIIVEAKWKGPEVLSIQMTRPWGPKDPGVYFAARSEEPLGWSDRFPLCFPRQSDVTVEQILIKALGDPVLPSQDVLARMEITYVGILFLVAGGIGIFAWGLRLRRNESIF